MPKNVLSYSKSIKQTNMEDKTDKVKLDFETNRAKKLRNKYRAIIDQIISERKKEGNSKKQQDRTLIKKAEFLVAYEKCLGKISAACDYAGIRSRRTFYNWCESDPDFKEALEEVMVQQQDYVEDRLLAKIADDNTKAIIWYLGKRHPRYMNKRNSVPPQKPEDPWKKWEKMPDPDDEDEES